MHRLAQTASADHPTLNWLLIPTASTCLCHMYVAELSGAVLKSQSAGGLGCGWAQRLPASSATGARIRGYLQQARAW